LTDLWEVVHIGNAVASSSREEVAESGYGISFVVDVIMDFVVLSLLQVNPYVTVGDDRSGSLISLPAGL